MPLVEMENLGLLPYHIQQTHTANTQQELLFQTVFPIAAIQVGGNFAVVGIILI